MRFLDLRQILNFKNRHMDDKVIKCRFRVKKRISHNTLRGKVQIVANRPLEIKHAYIEIAGFANCSFVLGKIGFKFPRIYPHDTIVKGFEQFYYTRHTLCGGGQADNTFHLHKGLETYPFSCYWPSRLPGTWSGDHGGIEYIGKVTMRLRDDEYTIYTHSQLINVKFKRELSSENHLLFECKVDVTRTFFATKSIGGINVSVWLPLCGISAGQSLPVICTIVNYSRLHFGGLLFLLTRIDIYRSDTPIKAVKKVRTDICRVARMVNIHLGQYEYYAVLQTDKQTIPTNQFYKCQCCQVIYEVWVSVQGAFPRYRTFGYPNIDTPGIPVVIGTKPLRKFDGNEITKAIFKKMYDYNVPLLVDELPEDVKEIIHKTDEELSVQAVENLQRQLLENEKSANVIKEDSSYKMLKK